MKKICIVGAGIAGLTAGIYALRSGFDVTLVEQHLIPGGNCTGWKRKRYYFEGGLHWLTGSNPTDPLNRIWRDIGAIDDNTIIDFPEVRLEYQGTKNVFMYTNLDKLIAHFLEISPEDAPMIKKFQKHVRHFSEMKMPVQNIKGLKIAANQKSVYPSIGKMFPMIFNMMELNKKSAEEYISQFKSSDIRALLSTTVPESYAATALIGTIGTFARGDGAYLAGGALEMVKRIENKFVQLGGQLLLNTPVRKVIIHNNKATGILLEDDETISADAVIIGTDAMSAIDKFFDEPLKASWIDQIREHTKPIMNSFISLGIRADLSDMPCSMMFNLEAPIYHAENPCTMLGFHQYARFPEYAPKGCTAATIVLMNGDVYDWWKKTRENGSYESEKEKLGQAVAQAIEKQYPQLAGKIDVLDVATPLSYERYCGTWKGSWMSLLSPESKFVTYSGTIDDMPNLFFAGQRLMPPGGLPCAAATGRFAAQYACRYFDHVFDSAAKSVLP